MTKNKNNYLSLFKELISKNKLNEVFIFQKSKCKSLENVLGYSDYIMFNSKIENLTYILPEELFNKYYIKSKNNTYVLRNKI